MEGKEIERMTCKCGREVVFYEYGVKVEDKQDRGYKKMKIMAGIMVQCDCGNRYTSKFIHKRFDNGAITETL